MRHWALYGVLLVVACLTGVSCGGGGGESIPLAPSPTEVTASFYQYDFVNFGNPPFNFANSEFGGVHVQFDAPEGVHYLNTVLQNGTTEWHVQNLPIYSNGGPQGFYVPLDLRRRPKITARFATRLHAIFARSSLAHSST